MSGLVPAVMEPLTPVDCDCRGLPYMPLEVTRLLDSELVALSTGDEFKAAFLLWAKAWTQVPAASIPDDDRLLARWAGYSLAEWRDLREMALRGWVKCSDGRLYHPVIADLAAAASEKRRGQAERANTRWAKARAAKAGAEQPRHDAGNAMASDMDATASAPAMQVKGKVEGEEEPPCSPPEGDALPVGKPFGPKSRPSPTGAEIDAIWSAAPRLARERSSRRDLERSLTAAMRRGHAPSDVKRGLDAAYASPSFSGDHAKGVHRLVENDRWMSFTEEIEAPSASVARIEANRAAMDAWADEYLAKVTN